jgi:tetratricopeptide (TPR) repeat protein
MDLERFLQRLVAARSKEERQALLRRYGRLDTAFFQTLKQVVRRRVEEDAGDALRIADIGLEAAEFAAEQEGVAYAWWARGNVLLFSGQCDDCLADYSTAIGVFAGLGRRQEVAQLQTNCMLPLMWTGRHAEAQAMGQSALRTLEGNGTTTQMANLLLNLGICERHQGNHAGAAVQAEQAAAIFARLNNGEQAARAQVTQAVALEGLDRFAEAKALLEEALAVFADHEVRVPWARAALNLGILHARLADHQAALQWMEESRRAFVEAGIKMEAAVVDLYRSQCLLDLNLLPEAEAQGQELVDTFAQLKMPRQVARAALLLAESHARCSRTKLAHRELERARRIFFAQGDTSEVAQIDLMQAAFLREMGRPGEALRLASDAARVLDVDHHPLRHAEAHLIVAACCEDLGWIEEAQVAYRVAWAAGSRSTSTTEPPPALAYRIAYARGAIAEAAGKQALARGEYGRAVGYLRRITQGLGLDELRGAYLEDKRPVYEAALRLALDDGRISDAFRYSELARAGTLRDFLAGRPLTDPGFDHHPMPEKGEDECAEVEDLKARWAWRVSKLHRATDLMAEAHQEAVRPEDRSAQLRELAELEQKLADAYRRRRMIDPRSAVLEQGEVLTIEQIQRRVPDGAALLAFDHLGDHLLAFVVTHDAIDIVSLGSLSGVRWDAAGLGHAVEEVPLFDAPADIAMLENELLEDLQGLYQAVMARPLALVPPGVHDLLVVPCDVLHTLPLGALHDGRRHLIERYNVCYLPSASLLAALPDGRRAEDGPALVVANSWEGRLPLTTGEARRVAQVLSKVQSRQPILLTEEQATARALRERAGQVGIVHIAAHGAFRADAPLFSTLHLADGLLTVNDVYGLDLLRTALVTLSGCQTGLGRGRGGEILGLAYAFFFAGAPALVVSRWRVDDEATDALMQDFYAALVRGETVSGALRAAQLGTLASRPHAYYWAGFAVWGRGFDPIFSNQ